MKKKTKHAKKNNIFNKIILIILSVIFIIGIIYICHYFYNDYNVKKSNEDILNNIEVDISQVTEQKSEKILKLEKLQKENDDIIGYLEIEGTKISYPVLQCDDNDYYLTRNYKKEKAISGSLFLDKDFDLDKPSTNYLIYGHRMQNGTMFEDLMKYAKEDFYKKHPTIKFTTNKEEAEYEIIAVFYSRVYYKSEKDVFRYYYFVNAENEQEFNEYVENSKKASIYDTGKTAKYGDQLMTLSTCEYSQEDGRFAVVAKKIDEKSKK